MSQESEKREEKSSSTKDGSKYLDLAFAMDCTSSMGSYIDDAKQNIYRIVEEIVASEQCDVRLALVEYRDHPPQDSTFVTNCHDFTSSPKTMKGWLNSCAAAGGGDTPEAVADALQDLLILSWREDATKICVCVSDAPPHGLGCWSDGFPDGCPEGIDPMVVANKLAAKEITLYVAGCEPAISSYKEFFMAIAYITGGQYVPMKKAQVLSKVIIGGVKEELSLNDLMVEVDAEIQSQADEGEVVNEQRMSELIYDRLITRGECVQQLQMNNAELGSALSSPDAKTYSDLKTLRDVRTNFRAKPITGFTAMSRHNETSGGSGGGLLNWIGSWFTGRASTSTPSKMETLDGRHGAGELEESLSPIDDVYETVKTKVTMAQSSRLVKKALAKHSK